MAEPRPDKYGPIEVAAPTHVRPIAVSEVLLPGEESHRGEPPRTGKGSGAEAWRNHAASVGVNVPDDASREDVISMVETTAPQGTDKSQEG